MLQHLGMPALPLMTSPMVSYMSTCTQSKSQSIFHEDFRAPTAPCFDPTVPPRRRRAPWALWSLSRRFGTLPLTFRVSTIAIPCYRIEDKRRTLTNHRALWAFNNILLLSSNVLPYRWAPKRCRTSLCFQQSKSTSLPEGTEDVTHLKRTTIQTLGSSA